MAWTFLVQGERMMYKLHATEKGLLIPADCLSGLPRDMIVRRVKDTLIIETESRFQARERLLDRLQRLRNAASALGVPDEAEIRELVDEVSTLHLKFRTKNQEIYA